MNWQKKEQGKFKIGQFIQSEEPKKRENVEK